MVSRRRFLFSAGVVALVASAVMAGTAFARGGSGPLAAAAGAICDRGGPGGYGAGGSMVEDVAQITASTVDDVIAARQAGQSLAQFAEGKGVATEDLVAALLESRLERMETSGRMGALTAEQLQTMGEQMDARIRVAVNRVDLGPPEGAGRGHGMSPRGGMFRLQATPAS